MKKSEYGEVDHLKEAMKKEREMSWDGTDRRTVKGYYHWRNPEYCSETSEALTKKY